MSDAHDRPIHRRTLLVGSCAAILASAVPTSAAAHTDEESTLAPRYLCPHRYCRNFRPLPLDDQVPHSQPSDSHWDVVGLCALAKHGAVGDN